MKFGVVSSLLMACLAAAVAEQAGEHVSKEQGSSSSHNEATATTCQDLADSTQCQVWAMSGECTKNEAYMKENCQAACGLCDNGDSIGAKECRDLGGSVACREWAWHGECLNNPTFMEAQCRQSCEICQSTKEEEDPSICEDSFDSCKNWASQGLCSGFWKGQKGPYEIGAPFVVEFCPQSCGTCQIHLDERDWKLGMGFPQTAPEVNDFDDPHHIPLRLKAKVAETATYILSLPEEVRPFCKFGHINCARFALNPNECSDHAGHYIYDYLCAAACQTCEKFIDNPEEQQTAQDYFDEALEEAQAYIDYQNRQKEKEARQSKMMQSAEYF